MQEYEKTMARPDLTKEEKKKLITESGAISTKKMSSLVYILI